MFRLHCLKTGIWRTVLFLVLGLTAGCSSPSAEGENDQKRRFSERVIHGEAQGTTWTVRYLNDTTDYTGRLSELLEAVDRDLSTYLEGSLINRINAFSRRDTVFAFVDSTQYFSIMFERSVEISKRTKGAFDPTVFPLVKLWGFGLSERETVRQQDVDSVMQFVGLAPSLIDLIEVYRDGYFYEETQIRKGEPKARLDFNAIAQGFSVDLMADVLNEAGVNNYMIELGGEVYCKGLNADGRPWRIAIDRPVDSDERQFQAIINVSNAAIVTSGSYRKFYEHEGRRFAHIIDPVTGYPISHNLLSVTVMAADAASADAYATAFMVMGEDATRQFLLEHSDLKLEVYLISDSMGVFTTWMSPGFTDLVEELL